MAAPIANYSDLANEQSDPVPFDTLHENKIKEDALTPLNSIDLDIKGHTAPALSTKIFISNDGMLKDFVKDKKITHPSYMGKFGHTWDIPGLSSDETNQFINIVKKWKDRTLAELSSKIEY